MQKQVYFNELIKGTLLSQSEHIQPSSNLHSRIKAGIKNSKKGFVNNRTLLSWKRTVAVACALLLTLAAVLAATPGARAYAAGIAKSLGIKIFSLTDEQKHQMMEKGIKIDADKLKAGQSVKAGGFTLQKANPAAKNQDGAVLSERIGDNVEIETKVDSFKVDTERQKSIKKNSKVIDASGELKIEVSDK